MICGYVYPFHDLIIRSLFKVQLRYLFSPLLECFIHPDLHINFVGEENASTWGDHHFILLSYIIDILSKLLVSSANSSLDLVIRSISSAKRRFDIYWPPTETVPVKPSRASSMICSKKDVETGYKLNPDELQMSFETIPCCIIHDLLINPNQTMIYTYARWRNCLSMGIVSNNDILQITSALFLSS